MNNKEVATMSSNNLKEIQDLLFQKGYIGEYAVTGEENKETKDAVLKFQRDNSLTVDGIVGPKTLAKLKETNSSSNSSTIPSAPKPSYLPLIYKGVDIIPLAAKIGISPLFLFAVMTVESGGATNVIRFEPHLFNRAMVRLSKRERMPCTVGPGGFSVVRTETDLASFQKAFKIDPKAAVESTSFGSGQVMGIHLLRIEPNPQKAVDLFFSSPDLTSAELMISWYRSNPAAIAASKRLDFAGFARLYNGPTYAANRYDVKIKAAYDSIKSKRPDLK